MAAYLYRGVISAQNIVANHHGQVTFEYLEARTGSTRTRNLNGDEFWWLILQHVLPKGFRRVRDDGFLHGNVKARLTLVQWVLRVVTAACAPRARPQFTCPVCHAPMQILALFKPAWRAG